MATEESKPGEISNLQFSLDGKWFLCTLVESDELGRRSATVIFDLVNNTVRNKTYHDASAIAEIQPANEGYWISQWDRSNEKLALSFLDARTGQRTTLDPHLSRRLAGFPHIFSDNAGHLYLLQNCKTDPAHWQHRARKTLIDWLNNIGFDWESTDEIEIRHISPDGKRLISEQTFSANYAEISPDGQYLILMSPMKNESKYVVYQYPIHLNWLHSLLWPAIPVLLLLIVRRRSARKTQLRVKD